MLVNEQVGYSKPHTTSRSYLPMQPKVLVVGRGIFVSGFGDTGGRVNIRLETAAMYGDRMIAPGTADQISGGVFTGLRNLRRYRTK
jgi:hypothetical protein